MSTLLEQASLVLIPSGYKEDVVYSQIPTDGSGDLSFTRASNGTRVNSTGLVEVCPWNIVQYSNTFSNAAWLKSSCTLTSGQNDPNGGTNGWRYLSSVASSGYCYQNGVLQNGVQYTFYIYAKSNTGSNQTMYFTANSGSFTSPAFTLTSTWQLCSWTFTANSIGSNILFGYNPSATLDLLVYGPQLNIGSTAKPYFPTTDRLNVPRLSYMYGSCPALLLEPQRTNLCLWSQNFDDANWGKTTASVTANQATAPDGTNTMDLLVFSATAGRLTQGVATTNGATYTFSVWLATQSGTQTVEIGNINLGVWQTVTVTTTPTRFSVTQVASSTSRFPGIQSTGAYSILAWGGQCELGAYPTTYIPTTTASATRIADSFSRNNIYTNGLITSAGGTWFVELRGNISLTRDAGVNFGLGIGDSGSTNAINIWNVAVAPTATRLQIRKNIASGGSATIYTTTADTVKLAIKWNGTSIDVFENGTKVVSASAFTITNMDFLRCSCEDRPRFIQAMALYPTPLSDTDCTTLTNL